jgi:hypothetical protein
MNPSFDVAVALRSIGFDRWTPSEPQDPRCQLFTVEDLPRAGWVGVLPHFVDAVRLDLPAEVAVAAIREAGWDPVEDAGPHTDEPASLPEALATWRALQEAAAAITTEGEPWAASTK